MGRKVHFENLRDFFAFAVSAVASLKSFQPYLNYLINTNAQSNLLRYIQIFVSSKIKIKTITNLYFSFYLSEDAKFLEGTISFLLVNPVNKLLFCFLQNQKKNSLLRILFFQKKVGTNLNDLCSSVLDVVKLVRKDFSKVYKGGVRHCSSDWNSCQKTPLKNEGLILS